MIWHSKSISSMSAEKEKPFVSIADAQMWEKEKKYVVNMYKISF